MKSLEIKKDTYWVGALDPNLRIFDIIMYTPYGTTYNSYVVKGSEKTAVFETVKAEFFDEYIERLKTLDIDINKIDYIIVDHTEPDHAGSVSKLLELSPKAKIVGSETAIQFMKDIMNKDFNYITVDDGDTLSLGNKTLKFISAPLLHWPDSMYTYVPEDNMLFTCDSFGSHYSSENVFNDLIENREHYMDALKYYFDCIMGPFKPYVLKAIDKIKDLKIDVICPGHGPVLRENPWEIVDIYKNWSTPESSSEKDKITISYVSAYGYTREIANEIAKGIKSQGDFDIKLYDIIHHEMADILKYINESSGILFGSPTINSDLLEPIRDILTKLNPLVHGGKVAGAFGSFGWSGEAVPNMENRLKELRMDMALPSVKVKFKPSEEDFKTSFNYGQAFAQKLLSKKTPSNGKQIKNRLWKCVVCGEVFEGSEPPEVCIVCGATKESFVEVKSDDTGFRLETDEKFVILGNGIAGFKAASNIRLRNKKASITMISKERAKTYYRPQLSDIISKEIDPSKFYVAQDNWFKDNNISEILGASVEKIDSENKKLIFDNKDSLSYDKLILANGSYNFIPPTKVTGLSKDLTINSNNYFEVSGVHTIKYLDDVTKLKAALKVSKKAVIIGGGLLGLEAAEEINSLGINTTVVEFSKRLLPRQLDTEGSNIFKSITDKSLIKILLDSSASEILTKDNKVCGVKLSTGEIIETDIVLFSVGIRSNIDIAKDANIDCNRGILVNSKMETSVKDIYACGDVSELNGVVFGNWPAATEMGRVAGSNAANDTVEFQGFVSSVVFTGLNTEVFCAGIIDFDGEGFKTLSFKDNGKYQKLFFKNNILVGGLLVGDVSKSSSIIISMENQKTFEEILESDII